jgi:hypothetical protein
MPGWIRWTLLALAGLAVAAAISVAASKLVSQRIGLSSEPLSAGRELAPPPRDGAKRRSRRPRQPTPTPLTTTTTPPTTTSVPSTSVPYSGPPSTPSPPAPAPSGNGEHEGGDD